MPEPSNKVSLSFIEEDDFDDFEPETWGKVCCTSSKPGHCKRQNACQPEGAEKAMWIDSWAIPNDAFTEKLKAIVQPQS